VTGLFRLIQDFLTLTKIQKITQDARSPLAAPGLLYPRQNSRRLLLQVDKSVPGLFMLIQTSFKHNNIQEITHPSL
jgi:hypothetical protein